jgi:hypothetical protein
VLVASTAFGGLLGLLAGVAWRYAEPTTLDEWARMELLGMRPPWLPALAVFCAAGAVAGVVVGMAAANARIRFARGSAGSTRRLVAIAALLGALAGAAVSTVWELWPSVANAYDRLFIEYLAERPPDCASPYCTRVNFTFDTPPQPAYLPVGPTWLTLPAAGVGIGALVGALAAALHVRVVRELD